MLTVPADAPAGTYEVEVFATDGTLESESVSFTVTVGEAAPFETILIQAEGMTVLADADANAANDNLIRTRTQNQERDGINNPDDPNVPARSAQEIADGAFDEYGIRAGYTGTGYLDINGTDTGAQAQVSFTAPAGTYEITLRLANDSGNARPITIDVDGVRATIADTQTPEWWQWETRTVTVTLETGGTHTLTILQDAGAGAPNIDAIAIHLPGTVPAFVTDTTADEGGDLAAASALASVSPDALGAVAFNLSGVDADVVLIEASTDGGATFAAVTQVAGAVTLDLAAFAGQDSVPVTFRVTDGAGNTAETTAAVTVAEAPVTLDPIVIQAEDASLVTVLDSGTGPGDASFTRVAGTNIPDAFGNSRAGAVGEQFIDFGTNPGDAIEIAVDAPVAGTYEVTFRYANGGSADRPMALSVGGGEAEIVSFAPTTDWEGWTDVTVTLDLAEGANTVKLAIPSAAQGGVANGPNIDQITFTPPEGGDGGGGTDESEPGPRETIRINFQDGTAPKAEGYLVANFDGYQDRGGISYGWVTEASATDADGTSATPIVAANYPAIAINERTGTGADGSIDEARDFGSYDPRLTGYAHFDLGSYPGAQDDPNGRVAFEVGVENGWYEVTVAVGDTGGPNDSDNQLLIEGQLASSFVPTEFYKTELVTAVVKVEDGHLTLSAPGGTITEAQYLEIRELPDLTPGDGREAPADYARFVNPVAVSVVDGQQFETDLDPASGTAEGVDPAADITIGFERAEGRSGGLLESLNDGSIRLFETLTGAEVPFGTNTTGGFDSLTISPSGTLKEFTSYTIVIDGFRDRGDVDDLSAPTREFQKFSTTFVTKDAPVVEAREVAFTDTLEVTSFTITSLEVSPDGQHLYGASLGGGIKRWDIDPANGSLSNEQTLTLSHFQEPGEGPRGIIGLVFDPTDPNTLWVTDNFPVPLTGRDDGVPDFSGRVSKITLGEGPDLTGTAETYITGLPRSNGDHVTNSLEFRANPDPDGPSHLLYVIQGSNSAMGAADGAWGLRPERLLNAAVMEIDPTRDAPPGGFNVATEPLPNDGLNRRFADPDGDLKNGPISMGNGQFLVFAENGTATVQDAAGNVLESYYDPFAPDAVLKLFATGQRNAYDLVWHSNGFLYVPTNGSANGGNAPNNPDTPQNEAAFGIERQDDYLFVVSEGTYSGHPNPLRDEFILNGGNPTSGQDPNQVDKYPVGILPEANYDPERAYSLGPSRSPNGAVEYTSDAFGASLKGAVLFAEYSAGNNIRAILVDPVTGLPTDDFVLRRPDGSTITSPDPLDVIQGADGRLYMLTLNRNTGESLIIRLDPAPGGEVADTTADAGGDLALVVIDATDPGAVIFEVRGLDADITTIEVSFGGGAPVAVTLDGAGRFTADLSGAGATVSAVLSVEDGAGNDASATATVTPGEGGSGGGDAIFIDAAAFTVVSAQTGTNATLVRLIDVPATHETSSSTDLNNDGLNDGYDGEGYLDPNGSAEDKASFEVTVVQGGTYELAFRMANGNGTQSRPIAIKIDGDVVGQFADTRTGSFSTWEDFTVTVRLEAGANTVVIAQTGIRRRAQHRQRDDHAGHARRPGGHDRRRGRGPGARRGQPGRPGGGGVRHLGRRRGSDQPLGHLHRRRRHRDGDAVRQRRVHGEPLGAHRGRHGDAVGGRRGDQHRHGDRVLHAGGRRRGRAE